MRSRMAATAATSPRIAKPHPAMRSGPLRKHRAGRCCFARSFSYAENVAAIRALKLLLRGRMKPPGRQLSWLSEIRKGTESKGKPRKTGAPQSPAGGRNEGELMLNGRQGQRL